MVNMICITLAFLIDAIIGDPYGFPHPVRYMGRYIRAYEKAYNKSNNNQKLLGLWLVISLASLVGLLTLLILVISKEIHYGLYIGVNIVVLWTCLAHKCLGQEAMKVLRRFREEGLSGAREQIGYLVARETHSLSEEEICKATVETVAENTSDGIIGPLFYMFIGGAPLAMVYKAVSTLDSTVGYKNERYENFGYYSAKADDVLNYIPARITALLMVVAAYLLGYKGKESYQVLIRDCRQHKSPNAGYPESATAGALGIQLGGDSIYFGQVVKKPTIGNDSRQIEREDIKRAVKIMTVTTLLFLTVMWLAQWGFSYFTFHVW